MAAVARPRFDVALYLDRGSAPTGIAATEQSGGERALPSTTPSAGPALDPRHAEQTSKDRFLGRHSRLRLTAIGRDVVTLRIVRIRSRSSQDSNPTCPPVVADHHRPLRCRCPCREANRRTGRPCSNGTATASASGTRCSTPSPHTWSTSKAAIERPGGNGAAISGNTVTNQQYQPQTCPDPTATRCFSAEQRSFGRKVHADNEAFT